MAWEGTLVAYCLLCPACAPPLTVPPPQVARDACYKALAEVGMQLGAHAVRFPRTHRAAVGLLRRPRKALRMWLFRRPATPYTCLHLA